MAQRAPFPPAPIPLSNYPEEKNCRKKNQQIDRDQNGQTDANHGNNPFPTGDGGGVTISFPHSMMATAHCN